MAMALYSQYVTSDRIEYLEIEWWAFRVKCDYDAVEQLMIRRNMLQTLWATIRQGKVELLESTELPEGTRVLVTLLPDDESGFWLQASQSSLDAVWDNTEDDVYAQLLQA
jgi:hypothetical protein